jgi:hypothetical protein
MAQPVLTVDLQMAIQVVPSPTCKGSTEISLQTNQPKPQSGRASTCKVVAISTGTKWGKAQEVLGLTTNLARQIRILISLLDKSLLRLSWRLVLPLRTSRKQICFCRWE